MNHTSQEFASPGWRDVVARIGSSGDFFGDINFSSVNEDWRTEARGLQVQDDDVALCVTGSGDRPLNLLAQSSPVRIVAIDLDCAQNELLRLKMAAIEALDYVDYVRFIGLREAPGDERIAIFEKVEYRLRPASRAFWRARSTTLAGGVLYAGRFERYFALVARVAQFLRGSVIERLFEFDDLAAQRRFVDETWDQRWWRAAFRVLMHPVVSRTFYGDPAYFAHVDVDVGAYVYDTMTRFLRTHLARESSMLSLIFRGRLSEHDLPPYLTREGVATLRERLQRIDIVTADVIEHLAAGPANAYSRFSLSDVPSYLAQPDFNRLFDAVRHAATPGARIVTRQFLTEHEWPRHIQSCVRREAELERELAASDRAFAYRFIVGTFDSTA